MTTDKALEILGMSEQARWRSGYEPTDEKEAIETIREALEQSDRYKKAIEDIKAEINTPNRNRCDYFIVNQIEKIVKGVSE